jgi:2-phosphoglycerate kinase
MQDPRRDLSHVLWLGGSTCAGKTTVAKRLAAAHGLRVYHCDEAFEEHRRRARPDRHPGFCRIMDLSAEELWSLPADEQVRSLLAFYADDLEMILEDLRALPADGPVLVEGTGLLPGKIAALAGDPRQALFLISTPDLRRRLYQGRGKWVRGMPEEAFARDDELALRRATEAAALGLPVVTVDGSRTVEETAELAARSFGLG